MAKGQALKWDFAARSVIGSGCNSALTKCSTSAYTMCPTNALEKRVPKTPEEFAYYEQLMDEEIYLKTIEWMLITIKGQVSIRLALGKPDPLELPRRLKQTLNQLFPNL